MVRVAVRMLLSLILNCPLYQYYFSGVTNFMGLGFLVMTYYVPQHNYSTRDTFGMELEQLLFKFLESPTNCMAIWNYYLLRCLFGCPSDIVYLIVEYVNPCINVIKV